MINIIKIYNHKKDYIIKKHLSIHSNSYHRTNVTSAPIIDNAVRVSLGTFSSNMEDYHFVRYRDKCRRLLDLYG